VDAVFSTATLHWVRDHNALFRHLAAVLRPGGVLVAQCGGEGNVALPLSVAEELGVTADHPHFFANAADTARRLEASGFADVWTWLNPEVADFSSRADLEAFLDTVVLRNHGENMPRPERAHLIRAVADRLPRGVLDYVRLNILARRGDQR
jgi:trans-aconitate 2-methyltransferase